MPEFGRSEGCLNHCQKLHSWSPISCVDRAAFCGGFFVSCSDRVPTLPAIDSLKVRGEVNQPIIEVCLQSWHIIFCPLVPSFLSLPLPHRSVCVDPHFGQTCASSATPLDSCSSEGVRTFLETLSIPFSEAWFMAGLDFVADVEGDAVLSCSIVVSSSVIRLTALSNSPNRRSTFPAGL